MLLILLKLFLRSVLSCTRTLRFATASSLPQKTLPTRISNSSKETLSPSTMVSCSCASMVEPAPARLLIQVLLTNKSGCSLTTLLRLHLLRSQLSRFSKVGPGNKDTRTSKETSFATSLETPMSSRMVSRPPMSTLMEVTHCSGTSTSHSTLTTTDAQRLRPPYQQRFKLRNTAH